MNRETQCCTGLRTEEIKGSSSISFTLLKRFLNT